MYSELRDIAEALHKEDPRFNASIRDVFEGVNDMPHEPFATEPSDLIVRCAREALTEEKLLRHNLAFDEKEIALGVFPAWTDAGFIANNTKAKCIIFGPGKLEVAHSAGEYIEIEEMKRGAFVYAMLAMKYCNHKKTQNL